MQVLYSVACSHSGKYANKWHKTLQTNASYFYKMLQKLWAEVLICYTTRVQIGIMAYILIHLQPVTDIIQFLGCVHIDKSTSMSTGLGFGFWFVEASLIWVEHSRSLVQAHN